MHGCRPTSDYHVITRSESDIVLELGGEPALDRIFRLIGPEAVREILSFPMLLTSGINMGDKFGDPREDAYVVRACVALDHERRGLRFAAHDLTPGTQVQLMRRSVQLDDVRRRARDFLDQLRGPKPVLALYFNCAGRSGDTCGSDGEDATAVQDALGPDIPLLGVYSGGELGKVGDRLRALNYSGVLGIISEQEPA